MWKGWNDSRYFPTFTPPYYCVFLGQDLESLCSGYLGDGAQRYPLGILKQHQTSKGAAVVLHVLSCIYKVQSRDLKCKAPNSYGLRWLPDCTPATRTLGNTEHWVRSCQICPCSRPLYRLGKGKACMFFTFCLRCRQKLLWEHHAKGPRCHIYFDGSSKAWLRGVSFRPTAAWL